MGGKIRLSGFINDSIVDGPGLRFCIFTQGCPHHCYKCHNPNTWPLKGGSKVRIKTLQKTIMQNPLIQGITLSGGEPLLQATACLKLARFAQKKGLDVILYTGYTYEEIITFKKRVFKKLLSQITYLIDGPFIYAKMDKRLAFRGSTNQRIIDVAKTIAANRVILADL